MPVGCPSTTATVAPRRDLPVAGFDTGKAMRQRNGMILHETPTSVASVSATRRQHQTAVARAADSGFHGRSAELIEISHCVAGVVATRRARRAFDGSPTAPMPTQPGYRRTRHPPSGGIFDAQAGNAGIIVNVTCSMRAAHPAGLRLHCSHLRLVAISMIGIRSRTGSACGLTVHRLG